MTDWRKVQGSQPKKPSEFDLTTSSVVVYQRKNIKKVPVKNLDGTNSDTTFWEYEEREMTHEEYSVIHITQLQQEVDAQKEQNLNTQMALVDLYEKVLSFTGGES